MYHNLKSRHSFGAAGALLLAMVAGACTDPRGPGSARDLSGATEGSAYVEGLPGSHSDRETIRAVEAGYVERLRLGLGSPFRLIDFALADPRLDPTARRLVAARLLEHTLKGRMYEIDPGVLQPGSAPPTPESLARATRHLEVIESAVAGAEDPRAGELAVRLAYQLGRLEDAVGASTLSSAIRVAALFRDRELAIRDAHALRRAAQEAGRDPIDLIPEWRAQRRFWVERPVLQTVGITVEQSAIDDLPRLLHAIRLAAAVAISPPRDALAAGADSSGLRRLRDLHPDPAMPPRSSVVVSLEAIGGVLPASLTVEERAAWSSFASAAETEEGLALRAAGLAVSYPALRGLVARSVLAAAIALRSDAQERVWFPGMSAPSANDLYADYGVRVTAHPDVPAAWVPYVLLSLDGTLKDIRSVVPKLSLHGLEFAITRESAVPSALASHSPRTRVIDLPVSTGLGTLAHEIAHDLDWQSAKRANSRARTYASDQVALRGASQFRSAVATLTPGMPDSWGPAVAARTETSNRPAEVVARTFDWFVVTRLAARGRWNGALSTGQDEVLTGHGSIQPPGSSVTYGTAAVKVMRPLAILPDAEVDAFLAQYGPTRGARAIPLLDAFVRRVGRIGSSADPRSVAEEGVHGIGEILAARDQLVEGLGQQGCVARPALLSTQASPAYVRLVDQAAAAKSRGYALTTADRLGGPLARAWMENRLFGPLWEPVELEASLAETLEALALTTLHPSSQSRVALASTFDYGIGATACARQLTATFGGNHPNPSGFPFQ